MLIALVVGVGVGWAAGPATGGVAGVVTAAVLGGRWFARVRTVRGPVVAGAERSTGYDGSGRFVLVGRQVTSMERGWARRVVRRDGVVRVDPRRARNGVVVVVDDLVTVDDEDFLLANPVRTGPALHVRADARLRRAARRHGLRGLAGPRTAVVAVMLVAVDLPLFHGVTWRWQVGLTLASLLLLVLGAAACIAGIAASDYPDGRILRSFVVDDVLHLDAGALFARSAPLDALRAGKRDDRLVRWTVRGTTRACPVALVPGSSQTTAAGG